MAAIAVVMRAASVGHLDLERMQPIVSGDTVAVTKLERTDIVKLTEGEAKQYSKYEEAQAALQKVEADLAKNQVTVKRLIGQDGSKGSFERNASPQHRRWQSAGHLCGASGTV